MIGAPAANFVSTTNTATIHLPLGREYVSTSFFLFFFILFTVIG